ncbi:hypothetical protein CR205_06645 [Alteribacter lacisalsi]|uniref:(d)CMP kinase n=1 Tax=Alteribacter lacisalsi TaxID=2045244 RepID=A0A2W0HE44_9BACI|nr:hypothetical protein [Alteribacter lacisalsi]PYZ98270.1 hypothetical protein CR205_06645 [Alteribacter lacisalsi]
MNRIMVTGVSAGAGKSTFAKQLSERTSIPIYHLNRIYRKPGWVESDDGEFSKRQREIIKKESWIFLQA